MLLLNRFVDAYCFVIVVCCFVAAVSTCYCFAIVLVCRFGIVLYKQSCFWLLLLFIVLLLLYFIVVYCFVIVVCCFAAAGDHKQSCSTSVFVIVLFVDCFLVWLSCLSLFVLLLVIVSLFFCV